MHVLGFKSVFKLCCYTCSQNIALMLLHLLSNCARVCTSVLSFLFLLFRYFLLLLLYIINMMEFEKRALLVVKIKIELLIPCSSPNVLL